jgi:hypothetical protein
MLDRPGIHSKSALIKRSLTWMIDVLNLPGDRGWRVSNFVTGGSFLSWIKGALIKPVYRRVSGDESPRLVKRFLVEHENSLKTFRAARTFTAWLSVISIVLFTAFIFFHAARGFLPVGLVFYIVLIGMIAFTLAQFFILLNFCLEVLRCSERCYYHARVLQAADSRRTR